MEERGNVIFTREKGDATIIDLRPFGLGLIEVYNGGKVSSKGTQFAFRADKRIKIWRKEVFLEIEKASA